MNRAEVARDCTSLTMYLVLPKGSLSFLSPVQNGDRMVTSDNSCWHLASVGLPLRGGLRVKLLNLLIARELRNNYKCISSLKSNFKECGHYFHNWFIYTAQKPDSV